MIDSISPLGRPAGTLTAGRVASPIGEMVAVVDEAGGLVYLDFVEKTGPTPAPEADLWNGRPVRWDDAAIGAVEGEIGAYFAGRLRVFSVPVHPFGNEFERTVWDALVRIPYGETISYGELARRVGRPGAARAVGRANGRNPVAVVVPCHRVIGADGRLTGYSGGTERRRRCSRSSRRPPRRARRRCRSAFRRAGRAGC
ncbi:MAG: methylated-DNA--[protein]-cysteine S-methyltransferase [Hyphomicrobiaceae bacterium]